MRNILITGASSGIGEAIAKSLINEDYKFILCGRNQAKLESLANHLSTSRCHILNFDIRSFKEVEAAIKSLPEGFLQIDILVNNAGGAHGMESMIEGSIEDWDTMIDTNLKGLLYISKLLAPEMVKRESGHIVNISSIAGKESYANGMVYCAAKAGVEAISKAMRQELNPFHVKVSNVAPGAVETNFSVVRFKGDVRRAKAVYDGFDALSAEDIANTVKHCLEQPDHVQIADVLVFPSAQASAKHITKK